MTEPKKMKRKTGTDTSRGAFMHREVMGAADKLMESEILIY